MKKKKFGVYNYDREFGHTLWSSHETKGEAQKALLEWVKRRPYAKWSSLTKTGLYVGGLKKEDRDES